MLWFECYRISIYSDDSTFDELIYLFFQVNDTWEISNTKKDICQTSKSRQSVLCYESERMPERFYQLKNSSRSIAKYSCTSMCVWERVCVWVCVCKRYACNQEKASSRYSKLVCLGQISKGKFPSKNWWIRLKWYWIWRCVQNFPMRRSTNKHQKTCSRLNCKWKEKKCNWYYDWCRKVTTFSENNESKKYPLGYFIGPKNCLAKFWWLFEQVIWHTYFWVVLRQLMVK